MRRVDYVASFFVVPAAAAAGLYVLRAADVRGILPFALALAPPAFAAAIAVIRDEKPARVILLALVALGLCIAYLFALLLVLLAGCAVIDGGDCIS